MKIFEFKISLMHYCNGFIINPLFNKLDLNNPFLIEFVYVFFLLLWALNLKKRQVFFYPLACTLLHTYPFCI